MVGACGQTLAHKCRVGWLGRSCERDERAATGLMHSPAQVYRIQCRILLLASAGRAPAENKMMCTDSIVRRDGTSAMIVLPALLLAQETRAPSLLWPD